jgi:hypothetical protein
MDDPDLRGLAENLLIAAGYDLLLATAGELGAVAAGFDPPDAVLLDERVHTQGTVPAAPCVTGQADIPVLVLRDGRLRRADSVAKHGQGSTAASLNPRTFLTAVRDVLIRPSCSGPTG